MKNNIRKVKYLIVFLFIATCVLNPLNSSMNNVQAEGASLQSLMNEYVGTYWTTDGKPSDSNGSTSKNYFGIQCKGFANYIFYKLFNVTYIGAYDSNKYYLPSPSGAIEVGKAWNIGSGDTATVSNILSRGQAGDFIQVRRRGKSYGHSMILVGKDAGGITVFDCNSDGKCGVKKYYISWADFAQKNIGVSLYHASNYTLQDALPDISDNPQTPSAPPADQFKSYIEVAPSNGEMYDDNSNMITLRGWAITKYGSGKGVTCINLCINGKDTMPCTLYERKDVSNAYTDYPKGNEGFECKFSPTLLQSGENTISLRAYATDKSPNDILIGDIVERRVNYNPKQFHTNVEQAPSNGETYYGNTEIPIGGWAVTNTGNGVTCVNLCVNGIDVVPCNQVARSDVAGKYPDYPAGKEGFNCVLNTTLLNPGQNTICLRAYASVKSLNDTLLGDFGQRTINYVPNYAWIDYVPEEVITSGRIDGWAVSGLEISRIGVIINDIEYEVKNRYERKDVSEKYSEYETSKAAFSYDIKAAQIQNGTNKLIVRAHTSDGGFYDIYQCDFLGIKLEEQYFDYLYYYAKYYTTDAEVKNIGIDAGKLMEHYYTVGINKGYSPCLSFEPQYYIKHNADLADMDYETAYAHFIRYCLGNGEKRPTSPWLNLEFYQNGYKEELGSYSAEELFRHHRIWGMREGRLGADTDEARAFQKIYNPIQYARHNADVLETYGDGTTVESRELVGSHFWYALITGEGRTTSDVFDFPYVMKTYGIATPVETFWWYLEKGYSQNVETIMKTEDVHTHVLVFIEAKPADCQENGKNAYWKCTECDKIFSDSAALAETTEDSMIIKKTDHLWNEGIVTKEPTESELGIKEYTCKVCGSTKTEEITGAGHKLVKIAENAPMCVEDGNKEYYICSECNKVFCDADAQVESTKEAMIIPKAGHMWDEGNIVKSPTATEPGMRINTCTVCGWIKSEEIQALGEKPHTHSFIKIETKAPTCIEEGNREYYVCNGCGKVFGDAADGTETLLEVMTIPKREHVWDTGNIIKEPTITESGEKVYTCTVCGETITEEIFITDEDDLPDDTGDKEDFGENQHTHKLSKVEKQDSTCMKEGHEEYFVCNECGKIFYDADAEFEAAEEGVIIPVFGHTWDAGTVTKKPTSSEKGIRIYTCSACGEKKTEEIEKLSGSNQEEKTEEKTEHENTQQPSKDKEPENSSDEELPEVGDKLIDEDTNNIYLVTGISANQRKVTYVKSGSQREIVEIPSKVTIDGFVYNVTAVGKKAFKNNRKLVKVILGKNIVEIDKEAFSGCKNLKTVTLNDSLKTIGDKSFYRCTALKKIVIPSKVAKIGRQAFYGCSSLKSITIKTTKLTGKKIGIQAFSKIPSKVSVKVPKGKINKYKKMLLEKGIRKKAKFSKV